MVRKSKEDWELWERVKKTAQPLQSNRAGLDFSSLIAPEKPVPNAPRHHPTRLVKPYSPEPAVSVSFAPKATPLDEATVKKIARGRTSIDARVDLHGMTQVEAYDRLFHFIQSAHASQKRTVLVITGKGSRGEGILKQAVPRWFSEPVFKMMIIGFREAHLTHGGSGALYVRLKNQTRDKLR